MVLTNGATIASYRTEKKGRKRLSRVIATPGCTMKTPTFVLVSLREAYACQLLELMVASTLVGRTEWQKDCILAAFCRSRRLQAFTGKKAPSKKDFAAMHL